MGIYSKITKLQTGDIHTLNRKIKKLITNYLLMVNFYFIIYC
jgi:hypothetical protein